jgi:signal transduction histidine kinase
MEWLSSRVRATWMLGAGLLVMLIIAVAAGWSSLETEHEHLQNRHIHDFERVVNDLEVGILLLVAGQKDYLITGDPLYSTLYDQAHRSIPVALDELAGFNFAKMGLSTPNVPIAELVTDRVAELDRNMAEARNVGRAEAMHTTRTGGVSPIMKTLHVEMVDLREEASVMVREKQDHAHSRAYKTIGIVTIGLLLSGGLAATSAAMLRREIIARRAAEDQSRERQAELARSNAELEQFASIASHDLQEPLRMVSSYTQLLRRRYADKLDAEANEFIGYAVDGAKRMQLLIIDLLQFSRIASRAKPMEPVDLELALDDTLKDLEVRIEDCSGTVTHDPLPTVRADPVQIRQLLLNLIGNGLKFQPLGGKPAVRLSASCEGRLWRFGVRDNGIGIDPQYFKNLFQIFKRLHTSTEYPGTGIGLALCKKIVERHGGRIWLESALGQGSTFFFTLPAAETPS